MKHFHDSYTVYITKVWTKAHIRVKQFWDKDDRNSSVTFIQNVKRHATNHLRNQKRMQNIRVNGETDEVNVCLLDVSSSNIFGNSSLSKEIISGNHVSEKKWYKGCRISAAWLKSNIQVLNPLILTKKIIWDVVCCNFSKAGKANRNGHVPIARACTTQKARRAKLININLPWAAKSIISLNFGRNSETAINRSC